MNRLSKEQWLDHGLANLAKSGFTSLKADTLAKSLGVSRGSFYWHFKDLATFQTAVLEHWYNISVTTALKNIEQQSKDPADRLTQIINIGVLSDQALEQAIRAWALNNSNVKKTVSEVDQQRLAYLQQLIEGLGFEKKKALARARIIYYGFLGQMLFGEQPLAEEEKSTLIEQLVTLSTSKID